MGSPYGQSKAWVCSIRTSKDGVDLRAMKCTTCGGQGPSGLAGADVTSTGMMLIDGNDDTTLGFDVTTRCLNGATCQLVMDNDNPDKVPLTADLKLQAQSR